MARTLEPASAPSPVATPTAAASRLLKHLLALSLPLVTLAFLATGPHPWYAALPWLAILVVMVMADNRAGAALHQPEAGLPSLPFDGVLYALVVLQLINIALLGRLVQASGVLSADAFVAFVFVGSNSGYSAIVVAHELIHRRERHHQLLGRLLLVTVCYEHFFTEHLRGHHVRVGTPEDPATARFGESFRAFWRRTVPGQFRSAWRLETKRLGDENMGLFDRRMLGHRVVHGLAAQVALSAVMAGVFGPGALILFWLQALGAVRLLEAVNYFEHWGLVRTERKVRTVDSWDSESWITLYSLVGLSRHADHHAHATRPYQELRHFDDSPKLPRGYFGMVVMVLFDNRNFRKRMTAELERRKLGPFATLEPAVAAE